MNTKVKILSTVDSAKKWLWSTIYFFESIKSSNLAKENFIILSLLFYGKNAKNKDSLDSILFKSGLRVSISNVTRTMAIFNFYKLRIN